MNIFEKASRMKLRFQTKNGLLAVEDLWDLPLKSDDPGVVDLDSIAVELYKKIKDGDVSFVSPRTKKESEDNLKFEIVKHIIDVKLKERDEAAQEIERKKKKEKIMEIIKKKEEENLLSKDLDDLYKMLEEI